MYLVSQTPLFHFNQQIQPRAGKSQYITGHRIHVRRSISSRGKQLHWDPHNSGPKGKEWPITTNSVTPHDKIAAPIYQ